MQLEEARHWWLANRDKAPWAFDEDVDAVIALIEEEPLLVGRALDRDPRVRRVFLARIRYYLYFQLSHDEQSVEVVAFWHGNRGSSPDL